MRRFPRRLVGYRRNQVDDYLRRLEADIASHVSRAQASLAEMVKRRDDLEERARTIREELASSPSSNDAYDRAMQEAARTAESMIEAGRYRAEQFRIAGDKEAAETRFYLASLDGRIEETRSRMRGIAEALRAVLAEPSEPAGAEEAGESEKVVARILSASGDDGPFKTHSEDGFLKIDVGMRPVKVVAPNGRELGVVDHLVLDKFTEKVAGYEVKPSKEMTTAEPLIAIPAGGVVAVKDDALVVSPSAIREEAVVGAQPAEQTAAVPAGGLAQRIKGQQMKYLVGRICGKSIEDANGSTIVCKGETITPEVVEKAKSAGRIADLIVNMTIPGVELDEEAAGAD